jgi:hypothetical protein
MRSLLTRWLLVTTALVFVGPIAAVVCGVMLPSPEPGSAGAAASPAVLLGWSLASSAIIAAVLVGLAARSLARGWTLAAGLFAIAYGIGHLSGLIEAYFFHVLDGPMTLRVLAMSAITSAVACALVARLTPPPADATDTSTIAWRPSLAPLAIVSGLYVVTYFAAGTLVFPFVESFYATRALPSTVAIVTMQLVVRGPLFGLILAWVASSTRGTRIARACWAGATLSLLGGVAPLLMPNPFFTDAARWAHFVETSSSNLIFGAVAGWIFSAPGRYDRGRTPMRFTGIAGASSRPGTSID